MFNYFAQTQPLSTGVDPRDGVRGTPREVFSISL